MMQQKQLQAKKSLGQNFLRHPAIIQRIVEAVNPRSDDLLLEIGCGAGALTRQLAGKGRFFVGIEVDAALCASLVEALHDEKSLFFNKDILTLNLRQLHEELHLPPAKFKVVGNLPYYISSPILEWLAQNSPLVSEAVIMLQAEVAGRLLAQAGAKEYGVLTLLVRYYFEVEPLLTVPPHAFWPPPKVQSKVVRLIPHPHRLMAPAEEEPFFALVKAAFSHRRKTLANCLKAQPQYSSQRLGPWLQSRHYSADLRGERLTLEDFVSLYQALTKKASP